MYGFRHLEIRFVLSSLIFEVVGILRISYCNRLIFRDLGITLIDFLKWQVKCDYPFLHLEIWISLLCQIVTNILRGIDWKILIVVKTSTSNQPQSVLTCREWAWDTLSVKVLQILAYSIIVDCWGNGNRPTLRGGVNGQQQWCKYLIALLLSIVHPSFFIQ